jgi:hypothetical protein
MRRRAFVLCTVVLSVVALTATAVMAADNFSGTWKLNVAKSKYSPDPAPKGSTTRLEATADGLKIVADGMNWEGKKTHTEYTAKFDGKDYPDKVLLDGTTDPNGADMVSARRIDDFTFETTTKLKGKTLAVTKNVISQDGKTRTQTVTGMNAQGKPVSNTIVYERQ